MGKITKNIDINGNKTSVSAVKVLDSKGRLLATAPNTDLAVKQAITNYRVSRETKFKDWQNEIILIGKSVNERIELLESRKLDSQNKLSWSLWDKLQRLNIKLRDDLRAIYKSANISNYTTFDIFRSIPIHDNYL